MKRVFKENDRNTYWLCKCECGNETIVSAQHLKNGHTKSCGCLHTERFTLSHTSHGLAKHPLYKIYKGIKERTTKEYNKSYKYYGDRGIKLCDEWENDFKSFYNWAMENGYKKGLTIDRIDVNGNYAPNNCRFVSQKVQQNNRRNNHEITYNSETHTIAQWADILGMKYSTLYERLKCGNWNMERALSNG